MQIATLWLPSSFALGMWLASGTGVGCGGEAGALSEFQVDTPWAVLGQTQRGVVPWPGKGHRQPRLMPMGPPAGFPGAKTCWGWLSFGFASPLLPPRPPTSLGDQGPGFQKGDPPATKGDCASELSNHGTWSPEAYCAPRGVSAWITLPTQHPSSAVSPSRACARAHLGAPGLQCPAWAGQGGWGPGPSWRGHGGCHLVLVKLACACVWVMFQPLRGCSRMIGRRASNF